MMTALSLGWAGAARGHVVLHPLPGGTSLPSAASCLGAQTQLSPPRYVCGLDHTLLMYTHCLPPMLLSWLSAPQPLLEASKEGPFSELGQQWDWDVVFERLLGEALKSCGSQVVTSSCLFCVLSMLLESMSARMDPAGSHRVSCCVVVTELLLP